MFCYKLLSIFIIHQDLSFGGIALKIEFVVFVCELINYEIIFLLLGYVTIVKVKGQAWFLKESRVKGRADSIVYKIIHK